MTTQKHLIKRLVLELTVADSGEAYQLQEEVSRICRSRLAPIIDEHCSAVSAPDRIDRIDSLEIDLGTLDHANLEADLVAQFTRQLPRALFERIGQAERLGTLDHANLEADLVARFTRQLPRALFERIGLAERQVKDREITPRSASQLELLAFFARTGRLPWWADPSRRRLLNDALEYLIPEAPTRLSPLMRELVREPESLRRIVLHADDRILAALFGLLAPAFDRAVPDFPEQLLSALRATHLLAGRRPDQLRTALWQALLSTVGAGERSRQGPQIFYRDALVHAAGRLGVDFESLLSALREALGDPSKGGEDRAGTLATILEALPPADDRPLGTGSGRTEALPTAVRDARKREPLREAAPVDQRFSDSDEVHLPNAGLVLLWPFLGHFFEQLGLMEGKQFKDAAAVHRAVGLLGYLATEDPAPEEYQLPLCKVLCGMELDEVFEFGPPLEEAEAEECSKLLTAVIGHAPILKNMSIAGFRGTFLIRQGVLSPRDGAWLLRVERKMYDVVLERFPWSWQWIKLPWMAAPLRVEWP